MGYGRLTVWSDENTDGIQEIILLYDPESLEAKVASYKNERDTVMVIEVVNARHQRTVIKLPPTSVPIFFRLPKDRFKLERLVGVVSSNRESILRVHQEPKGTTRWQ